MACWRCAIFPPMSDVIEKLRREIDALDDQLAACRGLEEAIRVSYLGPEGTFSEQAVRKHFGRAVEGQPSGSVDAAFRRCESGAVQFAVVPVENSTEGVVGRTLDLLLATPLRICAEIELRVQQNLLFKGESLRAVRRVYSHAQSLAQCNGWLAQHLPNAERIAVASNAEAAQRAGTEEGAAAIAGEAAAERYRLNVLARSIEDAPNNTTRFLVLGNLDPAPTGNDRTSLVMSAANKPGAGDGARRSRHRQARLEREPARHRPADSRGDRGGDRRGRALPRRQRLRAEAGDRGALRR